MDRAENRRHSKWLESKHGKMALKKFGVSRENANKRESTYFEVEQFQQECGKRSFLIVIQSQFFSLVQKGGRKEEKTPLDSIKAGQNGSRVAIHTTQKDPRIGLYRYWFWYEDHIKEFW